MNLPVAQEARIFEAGNQPQHTRLLAKLQMILEADQVITVSAQILLAQLHHGPGRLAGARIAQAHRLHRAKAQRISPPPGKNFDGQTALEVIRSLPCLCFSRLSRQQRIQKAIELRAVHRAINVIRRALFPTRGKVNPLHVNRVCLDNRRDRVIEGQTPGAGDAFNLSAQRIRSQRPGRQNRALRAVFILVHSCDLFAVNVNQRFGGNRLGNPPRKLHAIHRQRVAGRHSRLVGDAHQRRACPPHFLLQQPGGGVGRFALERVGADQLAKLGCLVGRSQPRLAIHHRAHLVEVYRAAQPRCGQRRLRTGQTSADYAYSHRVASLFTDDSGGSWFPTLSQRTRKDGARGESSTGCAGPASRFSASPATRILRHSSRNSPPIAR